MAYVFRGTLTPRKTAAVLLLFGAAMLAVVAPQTAKAGTHSNVSAMSLNLYLGTALETGLVAADTSALQTNVHAMYQQAIASNTAKRLRRQAKYIKQLEPDVIGVQEAVSIYEQQLDIGCPSACATKNPPQVAQWEILPMLKQALKKQGLQYKVASKQKNVDISVPGLYTNIRLVDYDAILVKKTKQIKTGKHGGDTFVWGFLAPIPLNAAKSTLIPRGYTYADMKIRGAKVRVVNTHLESFAAITRENQADELVEKTGPLYSKKQATILMGDLNSGPKSSPVAYETIKAAGFTAKKKAKKTCCINADLTDGTLSSTIDFVLGNKDVTVKKSHRTGVQPSWPGSMPAWPSDHAGVYSKLKVRR